MNLNFYSLVFCMTLAGSTWLGAQTTIAIQDFETTPATPTLTYTNAGGTVAGGVGTTPATNMFVGARSYQTVNTTGTITFATTSTVGYTAVELRLRLASFSINTTNNGADGTDNVRVQISTDGGTTWSNEYQINGNNNARWDFAATGTASTVYDGDNTAFVSTATAGTSATGISTITITGLPSITTLRVRVIMLNNDANELWALDNVELRGTPIAACSQTISGFAPASGPQGTEVTVTGTNFTAGATVAFNGIASPSVTFVNTTTLIAEVPAGNTTGPVTVTQSSCSVHSASNYTRIDLTGTCSSVLTGVIFSEIYDNPSGSLGYIELYNGTAATIDLTLYRIDRFGNIADAVPTHSYTFPAGTNIVPGQVLVGRVSNEANVGGVVPDFTFTGSVAGFNADDRLELTLIASGVIVDDFHDELVGAVGYVYRRNGNVPGPNPAFAASEWTTAPANTTSGLGSFVSTLGGPPTVSVQPTDLSACPFVLSVTAAPGNGGTLTYQWKFNNGVAAGWTDVTPAALSPVSVSGHTGNTLSLGGDLSALSGYQFYCQITENGACSRASHAAQFRYGQRFYRSAGTGNWTNAASWQSAPAVGGPWSAACTYPTFNNSDYIHILNNHIITLDASLTEDDLVIETGGRLVINNNRLLSLNNGTGTDLQIEGTLQDNGVSTMSGGISFAAGATWSMAANGELVKTGNGSVVQYRDNYQGGIANIPATAVWRYRYTANSTVPVVAVGGMHYPNLYFESTAGNYSFGGATEVFSGSSDYARVKGNFYIGNTGTGAVEVFNQNTNATPMRVFGDLIIGGNAAASISKFENNRSGISGTGIEVMGNILIHTNGLLDMDNGAAFGGIVRLHGNWTDLAAVNGFDEGNSRVEFVGMSNQTMAAPGSGLEEFDQVLMSKPAGTLQNTAAQMVIKTQMNFLSGIVLTSATQLLVFTPTATAINASNASHTNGPVVKRTSNVASTVFTFPTGKGGTYGAIGIETVAPFVGEHFRAEYFNAGYGVYNVNAAELNHVSHLEWWDLHETLFTTSQARVTLHWGPHSDVLDLASLRVAHYYTESPSVVNQWEREGSAPTTTGNLLYGTIASDVVTSFSPFTLADMNHNNSLPLELLRFEAFRQGKTGRLEWAVANEYAGDRYCLERSADALHFETLYCTNAVEERPYAAYSYTDQQPLSGENYYRLQHTDYLGERSFSPIRSLYFEPNGTDRLYPNPGSELLHIETAQAAPDQTRLEVIDALGRIVLQTTVPQGSQNLSIDVQSLPAGTYMVRLSAGTLLLLSEKWVKR